MITGNTVCNKKGLATNKMTFKRGLIQKKTFYIMEYYVLT